MKRNGIFNGRMLAWIVWQDYKYFIITVTALMVLVVIYSLNNANALSNNFVKSKSEIYVVKNLEDKWEPLPSGYDVHPVSGYLKKKLNNDILAEMLYYDGRKNDRIKYIPGMVMFEPDGNPAYWCYLDVEGGRIELFFSERDEPGLVPVNKELVQTIAYFALETNGFEVLGPRFEINY